jgi:hypothetical protein
MGCACRWRTHLFPRLFGYLSYAHKRCLKMQMSIFAAVKSNSKSLAILILLAKKRKPSLKIGSNILFKHPLAIPASYPRMFAIHLWLAPLLGIPPLLPSHILLSRSHLYTPSPPAPTRRSASVHGHHHRCSLPKQETPTDSVELLSRLSHRRASSSQGRAVSLTARLSSFAGRWVG